MKNVFGESIALLLFQILDESGNLQTEFDSAPYPHDQRYCSMVTQGKSASESRHFSLPFISIGGESLNEKCGIPQPTDIEGCFWLKIEIKVLGEFLEDVFANYLTIGVN